jgi:hypothetical protein
MAIRYRSDMQIPHVRTVPAVAIIGVTAWYKPSGLEDIIIMVVTSMIERASQTGFRQNNVCTRPTTGTSTSGIDNTT